MNISDYNPTVIADQLCKAIDKMKRLEVKRLDTRRRLAEAEESLYKSEKKSYEDNDFRNMPISKFQTILKYELLEEKYQVNKFKGELSGFNGEFEAVKEINNNLKKICDLQK